MARYEFDTETNGLLPDVSKVHVVVFRDVDTGQKYRGLDHHYVGSLDFTTVSFTTALEMLADADELIGHNILAYDLPVLEHVCGWRPKAGCKFTDTMVLSQLLFADITPWDSQLIKQNKLPVNMFKRYSLKAWGHRLGVHKGEYDGGWEEWNPAMQVYAEQDIAVTAKLHEFLRTRSYSADAIKLEHECAALCAKITRNGFLFDAAGAAKLYGDLKDKHEAKTAELRTIFPARLKNKDSKQKPFTPKRDDKKRGYQAGCPMTRMEVAEFNPNSRFDVAYWLQRLGWKPEHYGDDSCPTVDDETLQSLPWPEAKKIAELFVLQKRMGSIMEGKGAWLSAVAKDSRIHGSYNSVNGTATRRSSHFSPNIGQVPKVGKPYGEQCRSLFKAPPGYSIVGADLSSLEERCLGHYMSPFDGGEYAAITVSGDPHMKTAEATGLLAKYGPKVGRDKAKTFKYALLYGGQDKKIGTIVGGSKKEGGALRKAFFTSVPAYKKLVDKVEQAHEASHSLALIDGGRIRTESARTSLNYLLQGSGAILCKKWIVTADHMLQEAGLKHGVGLDYAIVAWVHDELQIEVKKGLEDVVGRTLVEAALTAGRELEFVPPLGAEYKAGRNWAETH